MTHPREEWPQPPTSTQQHEYVGDDRQPMSLDEINAELGIAQEKPESQPVDPGVTESHNDSETEAKAPKTEDIVLAESDADQPATSRKGRRRAQPANRSKGRVAAIASGTALGAAAAVFAVTRIVSPGGETEAPAQSTDTEEVAHGDQEASDPIENGTVVIDEPEIPEDQEQAEEPAEITTEFELNLPEAKGPEEGGLWQSEGFEESFKEHQSLDSEAFFNQYESGERQGYAIWLASKYLNNHDLEIPVVDAESIQELLSIPSQALIDSYNTLIHKILPMVHAEAGADEARKFLYGMTADVPADNPFAGEDFDRQREAWLSAIAAYPDQPIDHSGPYPTATTDHDMGAFYGHYMRQATARQADNTTLSLKFGLSREAAAAARYYAAQTPTTEMVVPLIMTREEIS